MAAHEEIRYRLQRKLTELVGEEEAAALMASLPPVAWTDLATKDDLTALERNLRAELRGGLGELRGEISELRGELRGEISELRGELHSEIGSVRSEIGSVRSEITLAIRGQTFVLLTSMVVMVAAVAGLVLGFA
jgi:hypothetical protein